MLQIWNIVLKKFNENRSYSYALRSLFLYMFFPVAFPIIIYRGIMSFRERFGLKRRPLEGKTVLLTGATSGIGESLSSLLYTSGCRLILASRRVKELERVKSDLLQMKTFGTVYIPAILKLDLEDLENIPITAQKALEVYGHIDILINNAGVSFRGTIMNTNIQVDQRIMTVNYFGPLALTKCLLPSMVQRKTGHIVFISSVQGKIAIPYRSSYTASKHAIQALADCLRAEMSLFDLDVSVVSPGYVKTQLSYNAITESGVRLGEMEATHSNGHSPVDVSKRIIKAIINCEKDVIVASPLPRTAIFLRSFCPPIFFNLMSKRARKESPLPLKQIPLNMT